MTKRMLIDASHPEETRVAIVDGQRLEDFDFVTSTKAILKGNIYLAKVTRVEPSLQAAFVDYGGNRHGFLAFGEIHPDYFQIPVDDRKALTENIALDYGSDLVAEEMAEEGEDTKEATLVPADDNSPLSPEFETASSEKSLASSQSLEEGEQSLETLPSKDESEENRSSSRRFSFHRIYKIQEVIKRNQILLVQVVREERGGKGAALTTYLSLPGRYCVLMPNTPEAGGISRKITSVKERKKMREILEEMQVPDTMSMIIRTAGKERNKTEIKRDAEYLFRLWDHIREVTLSSIAPTLVYEEANIIKRAIRDLYTKDIEEILVEGEEGYKSAKEFMRGLIPSHAKRVQLYKESDFPLFHWQGVEEQIDLMHNAQVTLPSGGYLVINPTEALVAIDINSGRATRERHIHETALKTNLEACDEIARQLRLRDLAGLIVIDFIDMNDGRHISMVERRLREAMQHDRARIQIGQISPFGLLELSRQRLRPSIIEFSTIPCVSCQGTGLVRSTESSALEALRAVEEAALKHKPPAIKLVTPLEVAFYILNQKRTKLGDIEARHKLHITVEIKSTLLPPHYEIHLLAPKAEGEEYKTVNILTSEAKANAAAKAPVKGVGNSSKRRRGSRGRGNKITPTAPLDNPSDIQPSQNVTPETALLEPGVELEMPKQEASSGHREEPQRSPNGTNGRRRSRNNRGRHRPYPRSREGHAPVGQGGPSVQPEGLSPSLTVIDGQSKTAGSPSLAPRQDVPSQTKGQEGEKQASQPPASPRENKSWWQRLLES